jgi:two-component system sensor histidine kinase KdpD
MNNNRSEDFLKLITQSKRGRLKIYLGYAPGVGKTYEMLQEGQRLKGQGVDVVIGLVETHGRQETAKLCEGLEMIPRKTTTYRGITLEEMDVDAIIARKPEVVLADELAHTDVPGSRNAKRYQDVQEILNASIHVITTLNVQHLESLYDTVERLIGVRVKERLPDSVLMQADQIVGVDLTVDDLRQRLAEGKVYYGERGRLAMEHFFQFPNLNQLRELMVREIASHLEQKSRTQANEERFLAPDQVLVCLSSRGPNSDALLRYASRLAGRLNRNWYALYVQTPSEEPTAIDSRTQRMISETLTLANQLGATVFTFRGEDVVDTILRFAGEYRIGHIVVGNPGRQSLLHRLLGRKSIIEQLAQRARGLAVVVVNTQKSPEPTITLPPEETLQFVPKQSSIKKTVVSLADLLTPDMVVIWNTPVTRDTAIRELLSRAINGYPSLQSDFIWQKLQERENQGSTFMNEGIGLPHARLPELQNPILALGITHSGILDHPMKIEMVFLFLLPESTPADNLQLIAQPVRLFLSIRRAISVAKTPEEAIQIIQKQIQQELPE